MRWGSRRSYEEQQYITSTNSRHLTSAIQVTFWRASYSFWLFSFSNHVVGIALEFLFSEDAVCSFGSLIHLISILIHLCSGDWSNDRASWRTMQWLWSDWFQGMYITSWPPTPSPLNLKLVCQNHEINPY